MFVRRIASVKPTNILKRFFTSEGSMPFYRISDSFKYIMAILFCYSEQQRRIFLLILSKIQAMLEDFRLKIFVTVSREGSFTKAAKSLGITQPAVSQNIAELEKETGVRLFERLRGEVSLTEQGRVLLDYAKRINDEYYSAAEMFSHLPNMNVRISASEEIYTYLLSPVLENFVKVHPDVTFERVLFEEADLVITMAPSPDNPFDVYQDSIAKLRISMSPAPKKMGDFAATHEKISYFDVLFKPSAAFACTKACRVLKDYFASLL